MAYPIVEEIQQAILKALVHLGGSARFKDLFQKVDAQFPHLTPAERLRTYPKGGSYWKDRVWWAGKPLIKGGEIDNSTRGIWAITKPPPPDEVASLLNKIKESLDRIAELAIKAVAPPPLTHEQVVTLVKEIGSALGKSVSGPEGPVYKHDVLWRDSPFKVPSEVFEICDSGNLEKDILSLQWATDPKNWGATGILVILDEKEMDKARKRLGASKGVHLVSGETVRQIHSIVIQDNIPLLKTVFR